MSRKSVFWEHENWSLQLREEILQEPKSCEDQLKQWDIAFNSIIINSLDTCTPPRHVRSHLSDKEWMTPHIKDQIRARQKAWVKGDKEKYQQKREMVAALISSAERKFYESRPAISVIRIQASGLNISTRSVVPSSYQKPQLGLTRLNYRKQRIFCLMLLLLLGRTESQLHCQSARLPMTWTTDLRLFQTLGKSKPYSNMWIRGKQQVLTVCLHGSLNGFHEELAPVVHDIICASIAQSKYPTSYKHALVSPVP